MGSAPIAYRNAFFATAFFPLKLEKFSPETRQR
jgi:hypothetical protein